MTRTIKTVEDCQPPQNPEFNTSNTSIFTTVSTKASGADKPFAAGPNSWTQWKFLRHLWSDSNVFFVGDASMSPYEIALSRRAERTLECRSRISPWLSRAGASIVETSNLWINHVPE